MYSKLGAILINSIFGICVAYSTLAICFALTSGFVIDRKFVVGFTLYNIVWLALDLLYNVSRYRRLKGGLFFWATIIAPAIILIILMLGIIFLFF